MDITFATFDEFGWLTLYDYATDLIPIVSVLPLNPAATNYKAATSAVLHYITSYYTDDEIIALHHYHFPEKHI